MATKHWASRRPPPPRALDLAGLADLREARGEKLPAVRFVADLPAASADSGGALLPPPGEGGGAPPRPLDGAFEECEARLAAAKTPLDAIPAQAFSRLSGGLDLFRGTKRELAAPEVGLGGVVTNATLKMLELLVFLEGWLPPPGAPAYRVFCNAELPGAFVMAIHHHAACTGRLAALDWVASSFAPEARSAEPGRDHEFLEDQYGLYAAHRGRWLMGEGAPGDPPPAGGAPGAPPPRLAGDLTRAAEVAALAARARARLGGRGAALYTSDAGIDVSGDFNSQEGATALLNFGQVLCGLLALAEGGCLVAKTYTFFRPFSRGLMAYAATLFEAAAVVKPYTSRPGNSEVYFVGRGFRGLPPGAGGALLARLEALERGKAPPPFAEWPPLDPPALAVADGALLRAAAALAARQEEYLREMAGAAAASPAALAAWVAPAARAAGALWRRAVPVCRSPAPPLVRPRK